MPTSKLNIFHTNIKYDISILFKYTPTQKIKIVKMFTITVENVQGNIMPIVLFLCDFNVYLNS